jgi:hypothetical protein
MDPDENLRQQRLLARRMLEDEDAAVFFADDVQALCELVEALDAWIKKGGFLPTEWRKT